jgi:hypothetical protein
MKTNIGNVSVEQIQNNIPIIEIDDPYAYVTGSKVIAYIKIKGTNGNTERPLMRTSKGGYVMQ